MKFLKTELQLLEVAMMYAPNDVTRGFVEQLQKDYGLLYEKEKRRIHFEKAGKKVSETTGISTHDILRAKENRISNFVKVNRAKSALCLFHSDKTPSMHIYDDKTYHCFACGAHGTVIDVVMKLYNISFLEAVKRLISK